MTNVLSAIKPLAKGGCIAWLLAAGLFADHSAFAQSDQAPPEDLPTVKASLGKESAWTGEAVPLNLKLYSPGPFSGTAAFDLPDLPLTVIIRGGSPVVGSETIDGETYFTQLHSLTIYTQRSGTIVIPSFSVRFAGKKTFTSAAEPMQGKTGELSFESKRPPGTDDLGVVVAVSKMEVRQSWSPASEGRLSAGDVVERTFTRQASGTTAMMMTPVVEQAPEGVRVYVSDPFVQDRLDRGTVTAERRDAIKYQFERPGTFTVPETSFVWWDSSSNELKQQTLPGKTFAVQGGVETSQPPSPPPKTISGWLVATVIAVFVAIGFFLWALIPWLAVSHREPETMAAESLLAACQLNDASAAYSAFLAWKRIILSDENGGQLQRWMDDKDSELKREIDELTRQLFSRHVGEGSFHGAGLARAFSQTRRALQHTAPEKPVENPLPKLNPHLNLP